MFDQGYTLVDFRTGSRSSSKFLPLNRNLKFLFFRSTSASQHVTFKKDWVVTTVVLVKVWVLTFILSAALSNPSTSDWDGIMTCKGLKENVISTVLLKHILTFRPGSSPHWLRDPGPVWT